VQLTVFQQRPHITRIRIVPQDPRSNPFTTR
jgi:hypothetical protein